MHAMWAGVLVGAVALAGCSASGGNARLVTDHPRASAGAVAPADPASLVGAWSVQAQGLKGVSLILADEARLFVSCGLRFGGWNADSQGHFVADLYGWDGACFQGSDPPPVPWLTNAVAYRVEGDARVLMDADGAVVARLVPGAHPTTGPNDAPSLASPPSVTPQIRDRLAEPAPLPAGATPAGSADVLGHWRAAGDQPGYDNGGVEFGADRHWSGSDGCNGQGGRYVVGSGGELTTTAGPSTLVGCIGSPAPHWVAQARRVAVRDGTLVLYDRAGKVLGALSRTGP